MSWLATMLVAAVTGAVALVAGGFVANLAVGWYRVSSFEGGAGYFVVGLALLSGIVGAVMAAITCRVLVGGPDPSAGRALGISLAVVLAAAGVIGGAARLLADIPPEIDGDELFLAFELRWPLADQTDPRTLPGPPRVRLGTVGFSRVVRKTETGVLLTDDAARVDGRWVVPGAVAVFTSRGKRLLLVEFGERSLAAFQVPLPAHPGPAAETWSDWLPRSGTGAPLEDGFRYRFRAVRRSQPIRVERSGPFEIATIASYFHYVSGTDRMAARSSFRIDHAGTPVPGLGEPTAVALLPGEPAALLVGGEEGECRLVASSGTGAVVTPLGPCGSLGGARPVTNDSAVFQAAKAVVSVPGWFDRTTFAEGGRYRLGGLVFDTRTRDARPFDPPDGIYPLDPPGLVGISPDARSVVWFAHQGADDTPVIGVSRLDTASAYLLPVDRASMRYPDHSVIDPAWIAHHFEWRPGQDADRLAQRPRFAPLPFRGLVSVGQTGYASYTLPGGGEPLRAVILEFLASRFGGTREPDEIDGYRKVTSVHGQRIGVVVGSTGDVTVQTDFRGGDPAGLAAIAAAFDSVLATGRYDSLFAASRQPEK